MDPTIWIAFVLASTVLVVVPGPTVLLVLSLSVSAGRRVALPVVAGVALGDLLAMTTVMLGLGAVVLASATLFAALKWAGALYLVWIGLRTILGAKRGGFRLPRAEVAARQSFRDAFWVTALNPKSVGFFVAFVPQFLDPAAAYAPQAAILTATFVVLGSANALAYALLAGRLRDWLARGPVALWLTRAAGGTLVLMGLATAAIRRPV